MKKLILALHSLILVWLLASATFVSAALFDSVKTTLKDCLNTLVGDEELKVAEDHFPKTWENNQSQSLKGQDTSKSLGFYQYYKKLIQVTVKKDSGQGLVYETYIGTVESVLQDGKKAQLRTLGKNTHFIDLNLEDVDSLAALDISRDDKLERLSFDVSVSSPSIKNHSNYLKNVEAFLDKVFQEEEWQPIDHSRMLGINNLSNGIYSNGEREVQHAMELIGRDIAIGGAYHLKGGQIGLRLFTAKVINYIQENDTISLLVQRDDGKEEIVSLLKSTKIWFDPLKQTNQLPSPSVFKELGPHNFHFFKGSYINTKEISSSEEYQELRKEVDDIVRNNSNEWTQVTEDFSTISPYSLKGLEIFGVQLLSDIKVEDGLYKSGYYPMQGIVEEVFPENDNSLFSMLINYNGKRYYISYRDVKKFGNLYRRIKPESLLPSKEK